MQSECVCVHLYDTRSFWHTQNYIRTSTKDVDVNANNRDNRDPPARRSSGAVDAALSSALSSTGNWGGCSPNAVCAIGGVRDDNRSDTHFLHKKRARAGVFEMACFGVCHALRKRVRQCSGSVVHFSSIKKVCVCVGMSPSACRRVFFCRVFFSCRLDIPKEEFYRNAFALRSNIVICNRKHCLAITRT